MIDLFGTWPNQRKLGETSQSVSDALKNNWMQAVQTRKASIGDLGSDFSAAGAWTELKFDTGEEEIIFKGKEIKYLKEMLNKYIKENHPEELL